MLDWHVLIIVSRTISVFAPSDVSVATSLKTEMKSQSQGNRPAISVVIPTYNRGSLLIRALESVFTQTFQDYEVIVVDDGSNDCTKEKLKPYFGKIRYFYQRNKGASDAQQKGIELAVGKWVSILASDDVWLPKKLELQMKVLCAVGSDFGVCFTDCCYMGRVDPKYSVFQQAGLLPGRQMGALEKPLELVLAKNVTIFVQSCLILRSLVSGENGFDTKLVVSEDTDLLFRLTFKTQFCFVNEVLVHIDATPSRTDRLSLILHQVDDRKFYSREIIYDKWIKLLARADLVAIRGRIEESQKINYYEWLVASMQRFKLRQVVLCWRQISCRGDTPSKIIRSLLFKANRRMRRLITLRGGGHGPA